MKKRMWRDKTMRKELECKGAVRVPEMERLGVLSNSILAGGGG
jgi:hypothetical protein